MSVPWALPALPTTYLHACGHHRPEPVLPPLAPYMSSELFRVLPTDMALSFLGPCIPFIHLNMIMCQRLQGSVVLSASLGETSVIDSTLRVQHSC
jgi:hypothetical protein